jgi:GT2 family glycosyltransferase
MPELTLIIPCRSRESAPLLAPLIDQLERQTFSDFDVYVIQGDRRQGRAINNGVRKAQSPWIMTMDDDTVVDDDRLLDKSLTAMKGDSTIGMGGAATAIPKDAGFFERAAYRQIKRRWFPTQEQTVDSDMVQHPCLCMPRELFLDIGGEDEDLIRGLDPILRKKVRDAGKRVAIIADTWIYHALPWGPIRLFRNYFRNGRGSAFARRHHPDRIIELTEGYEGADGFVPRRSFPFRILRRLGTLLGSLITLKWFRLWADLAYSTGYFFESIFARSPAESESQTVTMERECQEGNVTYWKTSY